MTIPQQEESIDLLFLGTGTSTGLPLVPCLTLTESYPAGFERHVPLITPSSTDAIVPGAYNPEGEWPDNIPCACCRSAVSADVPEGWKNRRGNTSVVVRKKRKEDGQVRNVVVDVGKTFKEQSGRFFPAWGVDRIDAVILTHGHADAYFGLDDLREWCIRQNTVIPVYLNQETYAMVASSFPYLVDKTKASGGGDVPSLRFIVIADDEDFEVEQIRVKALAVEHGVYFHNDAREPLICLGFMFDESVIYMSDVSSIPDATWARMLDRKRPESTSSVNLNGSGDATNGVGRHEGVQGQVNGGGGKVVVPPTPQDTPRSRSPIERGLSSLSLSSSGSGSQSPPPKARSNGLHGHFNGNGHGFTNGNGIASAQRQQRLPVLVIDALWPLARHSSHTNLPEALTIALKLKPLVTYVVDVVHPVTHYMWEELGRSIKGEDGASAAAGTGASANGKSDAKPHPDDAQAKELVSRWWADPQVADTGLGEKLKKWGGRVEPGWDGLVVKVGEGKWEEVKGKRGSTKGWTV